MVKKKRSPYFDEKETRSLEERREDQAKELAAMMRLAREEIAGPSQAA